MDFAEQRSCLAGSECTAEAGGAVGLSWVQRVQTAESADHRYQAPAGREHGCSPSQKLWSLRRWRHSDTSGGRGIDQAILERAFRESFQPPLVRRTYKNGGGRGANVPPRGGGPDGIRLP